MVSGAEARTTQQAAAAIVPHRPGQETGSRKKKAVHPVHLAQRAKHDITKALPFIRHLKCDPPQREKRKKHAHLYLNTHQRQHHNSTAPPRKLNKKTTPKTHKNKKKQRSTNIPTCRQTDMRCKAERRHARTHLPGTQRKLTDKHTKQRAQSTAQPEVYFMQEYSKVCFTIQLNIKGGYIPL